MKGTNCNEVINLRGRSFSQYTTEADMYKSLILELQQENEDLRIRLKELTEENKGANNI